MTTILPTAEGLQSRLTDLAKQYQVPGAVVGVLAGEELTVCATGQTRLPDGPPVSADTAFLIASITKPWTATLVLQLVDEGLVELDEPVNRYLQPKLELADAGVAETVTVRQLLTHSGGFFGDRPEPDGRGDDAVRRELAGYGTLRQLHVPGSMFSYCNAGYNVLGRLVECLTERTWDDALRKRLLEPLHLNRSFNLAEQAMVHPVAIGHDLIGVETRKLQPVKVWQTSRGGGPCGATLSMTAHDLLAFAKMHLRDGAGPDGNPVLSAASARAMRDLQITQPDPSMGPGWGLGWQIYRTDPLVIGHGGNTSGQQSILVLAPAHDFALCILTNGDVFGDLRKQLVAGIVADVLDTTMPDTPAAAENPVVHDANRFVGTYSRDEDLRIDIGNTSEGLVATFVPSGPLADAVPAFTKPLLPAGGDTFLITIPPTVTPTTLTFLTERSPGDELGQATHLAMSLRVVPRA